MATIRKSARQYENWLREQLHGDVLDQDLAKKHDKMRKSAFVFLRATYWRWAEMIFDVCPDLVNGTQLLAVGDIHIENYGTWRDVDGRLVWGVNDFDEAAQMPEALTGCTRDELIGAPFKSYFTDPEPAEAGIKLVLSEKKVTDYELTACARDGKQTVVSYNATGAGARRRAAVPVGPGPEPPLPGAQTMG